MPVRRDKKTKKYRGSRVHGFGRVGQHRKSGMRGGKGRAGRHKHLWSGLPKAEKKAMGTHGFTRYSKLVKPNRCINVGELQELIESFELIDDLPEDKEQDGIKIEDQEVTIDAMKLGYDKILGGGHVSRKMNITALGFSKTAIEKIEAAGGTIVSMAEE